MNTSRQILELQRRANAVLDRMAANNEEAKAAGRLFTSAEEAAWRGRGGGPQPAACRAARRRRAGGGQGATNRAAVASASHARTQRRQAVSRLGLHPLCRRACPQQRQPSAGRRNLAALAARD